MKCLCSGIYLSPMINSFYYVEIMNSVYIENKFCEVESDTFFFNCTLVFEILGLL